MKAGNRVELIQSTDQYTDLKPGDRGTVAFVDDIGTVHIDWDEGSDLGLVPGEDRFKIECPNCNGFTGVPIVYGLPYESDYKVANRGDVILGGCCVGKDDPKFQCLNCKHQWGAGKGGK